MSSRKNQVTPSLLKGFQDYSPRAMSVRLKIMEVLRKHAKNAGFHEISTPALEYSEVLLGVGGDTDKQVFRFRDGGNRDVGMRYDLTVPFARYVSKNFRNLPMPFRRIQFGDVWRAEKPQRGRFREFCQGDLDIIGVDSLAADLEVIQSLFNTLSELLSVKFTITCNHRKVLSAIIRHVLGIDNKEEDSVLIILDKLDKIGRSKVIDLLLNSLPIQKDKAEELLSILISQDEKEVLNCLHSDSDKEEWNRFKKTINILNKKTDTSGSIKIDLSVARGLAYYTGVVFESTIDNNLNLGSVCSGGRYDKLTKRFTSQEMSGVGGSIGVDRLATFILEQDSSSEDYTNSTQTYVAITSQDLISYAFDLVQKMRSAGIVAEISVKEQKLANQFRQANKRKIPCVITVGEDEVESSTVKIKNMKTGEEVVSSYEKFIEIVEKIVLLPIS